MAAFALLEPYEGPVDEVDRNLPPLDTLVVHRIQVAIFVLNKSKNMREKSLKSKAIVFAEYDESRRP